MKMIKFLTRNYSFLSVSLMSEAWKDFEKCRSVTGISDCVTDIEYARTIWRLDENWIDNVSKSHLSTPLPELMGFIKRGQEIGNQLCVLSRKLFENNEIDRQQLPGRHLNDLLSWIELFQSNAAFILITHPLAKAVEKRLLEVLTRYGLPDDNLDQALLDLSITRKSNAAEEENFDLFFIQRRMTRPDFDVEKALQAHTRQHAFLNYRDPFSGGFTIDYFRERLNTRLELPNYFLPYSDIIEQFDAREKELIELHEEFVFYRTYRTERSYEALYYLEKFLENLENATNLEKHELSFYTAEELTTFLSTGRRVEAWLLADRMNEYAMTLHNETFIMMQGSRAKDWIETNFKEFAAQVSEVKGLAAYRGKITGKARILLSASDQHTVNEGDILIVPMTTPDYLPSMQRAAGFVTDEGGVICHAAIVARELKKPCVIGTKKATSVFQSNDTVEVDGFTGMVRLIARA